MHRALSLPVAPLDIFLNRSHGLPLPYLTTPSLSFLVHLTPLEYLNALRTAPTTPSASSSSANLPKLDVPLTHLRQMLVGHPRPQGAIVATLSLEPCRLLEDPPLPPSALDAVHADRPTFTLAQPDGGRLFPQISRKPQGPESTRDTYVWILDFTSSGRSTGIVISQSRMREIERILQPATSADGMGGISLIGYGTGSRDRDWVDMLVSTFG